MIYKGSHYKFSSDNFTEKRIIIIIKNMNEWEKLFNFCFLCRKNWIWTKVITINDYIGCFSSLYVCLDAQFVKVWWSYDVSNMSEKHENK